MTEKLIRNENEAIEAIKSNMSTSGYYMLREALDMAISVLEEIRQYRATGTVEECRAAVDSVRTSGILPDKPQCKEPKYMHDREEFFGAADFYKKRFLEVK